jgi:hypothetical protein
VFLNTAGHCGVLNDNGDHVDNAASVVELPLQLSL